MNFSNFKLGIYDILGLVIPGMILVCEMLMALNGWLNFKIVLNHMSGTSFTLLLLFSFVLGHLIQEMADVGLRRLKGSRFFSAGRDEFWSSDESDGIKSAIWAESGVAIGSADSAFDYCLTRIGDRFSKRDTLLATADLSRSFLVLVLFGIPPAVRLAWDTAHSRIAFVALLVTSLVFFVLVASLSWRRMVRFRRMSEMGVFRAYLGSRPITNREEDPNQRIA